VRFRFVDQRVWLLGIALKLLNIKQIAIGSPLLAIALAPIFA